MAKKRPPSGRDTTPEVKYVWKPGAQRAFGTLDPEPIGREIDRLYLSHGRELTAEKLADAALDPSSPLHPAIYHVEDEEAARLHFIDRARLLMRMTFKITVIGGEERTIRLVQPVSRPLGPVVYKDLPDIMNDPEYKECLLRNAIRELLAVRRKFATIQELALVFAAIDQVTGKRGRGA
jgi:hypothetical protein